jgi:hypothetical protein
MSTIIIKPCGRLMFAGLAARDIALDLFGPASTRPGLCWPSWPSWCADRNGRGAVLRVKAGYGQAGAGAWGEPIDGLIVHPAKAKPNGIVEYRFK